MILDDLAPAKPPSKEVMVPFWEAVMSSSDDTSPEWTDARPVVKELWFPVTPGEIKRAMPASTTSAGPDGLSARMLKKVPTDVLCRIFSLIMWCQELPSYLLDSTTLLIPKKFGATLPSDFRPITISSVLIRAFHKVLASRLSQALVFDQRQRAFRPTDGCSDNTFLLDLVLRYHHNKHKHLYVASLDIAKAFDSVAHSAIRGVLGTMGLPCPMVEYITDMYSKSVTRLCCDHWTSKSIRPTCGVKQGDPMSPIIFNMIIEQLLKRLPEDLVERIGETNLNAAAFADDLLLFASTPGGLQRLIDNWANYLSQSGLLVNTAKCFTVSLKNVPHEKKSVVDGSTVFLCQGNVLPALRRSNKWKYLGIPFTPEGRVKIDVTPKLTDAISKLTKAPLKPQQRLFAIRTMVVPALYHQLELGNTTISMLRKSDRMLRQAVRKWLNLPTDAPNAYVHATTKDEGLGIPFLRWIAPMRRLHRLLRLPISGNAETPNAFLSKEVKQCRDRLVDGIRLETFADVNRRWAAKFYAGVDGGGLQESAKVPQQNIWIREGTRFLTGRDFVMSCKLRINALLTKSRTTRGQMQERFCRAGCNRAETLNHVLQICHRTHGSRIKRHNALASFVARALRARKYAVSEEPRIQSERGLRKPDIIAKLGKTALVIDAQVVNDQVDIDRAHKNKADVYKDLEDIIKRDFDVKEVRFTSITLPWRGVWSGKSADSLVNLGVVRKSALKILSSRTIIGRITAFHQFNRTTAVG